MTGSGVVAVTVVEVEGATGAVSVPGAVGVPVAPVTGAVAGVSVFSSALTSFFA